MTGFDAAAAERLVADRIAHATVEEQKATLRVIMADPLTSSADYAACRAKMDLIYEQANPGSHGRVIGCDGISRAPLPKPSEAVLAKRAEIRTKLEGDNLPRRLREELHRQLSATYGR